ncbi:GNAT family N-acetyltransferase [Enterococcus sp. BWM-S5]|uniref:GNAT family N-acetyltransferase n=1 Tax=Enterococcus larvae TaxID=2794352 RepID=A0ABS4CLW0_9ENTE|nr:GNAT family N-acetyltransferase [Enterococcus larvae]MBP1047111.1 GNAT family N-acetyltransferase [Enterococcus larvae]
MDNLEIYEIVIADRDFKICETLMNENIVKNDGKGILSEIAIYDAEILIVASVEKEIIGYCAFSRIYDYVQIGNVGGVLPHEGFYIEQILVLKEYQRKGVAFAMVDFLQKKYQEDLFSHVSIKNKKSILMHIKHNFQPIDFYMNENFYGITDYVSLFMKRSYT